MKRHELQLLMDLQELVGQLEQDQSNDSTSVKARKHVPRKHSSVDVSGIKKGRSTFSVTYKQAKSVRRKGAEDATNQE